MAANAAAANGFLMSSLRCRAIVVGLCRHILACERRCRGASDGRAEWERLHRGSAPRIPETSGSRAAASATSRTTRCSAGRCDRSRSSTICRRRLSTARLMTCAGEDGGERFGASFLIPRSQADLVKRRESMKVWADATFGMVGRSPDYLNTVLMTGPRARIFSGRRAPQFADNVRNYYAHCRDRDLFLTHAIVNPQSDRSKASHEQETDVRASRRGRGDEGRPDRARCQDARHPRADGGRAPGLSAAGHPRRRGTLRHRLRHADLDARACGSSAANRSTAASSRSGTIRSAPGSRSPTRSACSTTC